MFTTHNDNPVLECSLGRKEWREGIIRQIVHSDPPKVIAIHGTWGTGKTSLLAQMYVDLGGEQIYKKGEGQKSIRINGIKKEDRDRVKPVWFEAWQYQHEENVLAALLKEIRDQLSWYDKAKNSLDEAVVVGLTSVLQSIDVTIDAFGAKFGFKNYLSNVKGNVKEYERERISTPLDSVMLKKMLKEAIDQLLNLDSIFNGLEFWKRKKKKAVIFIDDLDRCLPHVAFKILESLKVYLNLENCVFVLGMDREAIDRIITQYQKANFNTSAGENNHLKNLSRLYLEKICQDIYHLPALSPIQKLSFFNGLIKGKLENGAKVLEHEILKIIAEYNFLPPFPRSIKIFANVLISHCASAHIPKSLQKQKPEDSEIPNLKPFLIFAYLYAFHDEVYKLCSMYPDFYNDSFLAYCKEPLEYFAENGEHPALRPLQIPIDNDSAKEMMGATSGNQDLKNTLISSRYPHTGLRQVLWIRKMVVETGKFPDGTFDKLKL